METEERINKVKVQITMGNPFFAYLSLYLRIKNANGRLPEGAGMGVDAKGNVFYNEDWVKKITDDELKGVLLHELLHCALLHLIRIGKRNKQTWNFATDLAINTMLLKNGYKLPKGLRADAYDNFKIEDMGGNEIVIEKISEKTAEEIYAEFPEMPEGEGQGKGFDIHIESDEGEGDGEGDGKGDGKDSEGKFGRGRKLTESELAKLENEWLGRLADAVVSGIQRGNLPAGMERYAEELKKGEVDWRSLLRKYIQAQIPTDVSYNRRSKKSYATGFYMPNTVKEKINIAIGVDTSGSIGEVELSEFLSEVVSIAKTYKEVVDMKVFSHDTEVQSEYLIKNGNINKILELRNKLKGGGGTSHIDVMTKINKEKNKFDCAVFFTDGYSDLEQIKLKDYPYKKIFIINKSGQIPKLDGNAITIKKRM